MQSSQIQKTHGAFLFFGLALVFALAMNLEEPIGKSDLASSSHQFSLLNPRTRKQTQIQTRTNEAAIGQQTTSDSAARTDLSADSSANSRTAADSPAAPNAGNTAGGTSSLTPGTANSVAPVPAPATATETQLPELYEFNLKEFDPSLSVTVKAALNAKGDRVEYNLEGDICTSCFGITELPIGLPDVRRIEYFKRVLARDAIRRIQENNVRIAQQSKSEPAAEFNENIGVCDMKIDEGKIACEVTELRTLANRCEAVLEDRKKLICKKKVEAHFRTHVLNVINQGLKSESGSTLYDEAIEARDQLIASLPSRYDNSIRRTLTQATAQSLLTRAEGDYNTCILNGCAPDFAARFAKNRLKSELSTTHSSTVAGRLFEALTNYGASSDSANSMGLRLMYNQDFQNPLLDYFNQQKQQSQNAMDGLYMPGMQVDSNGTIVIPGLQSATSTSTPALSAPFTETGSAAAVSPRFESSRASRTQRRVDQNQDLRTIPKSSFLVPTSRRL